MSAVTEILAMRSEIEGRFEMLDLAIERIEAERREYRIRLETLNTCLDLVSREVAEPEAEEKAEGENVTRVTPVSGRPHEAYRVSEAGGTVTRSTTSAARPAARASKRAPRRNPRQVVLELIRKAKGEGTKIEALDAAMPTYRKRLIENAVAHWISKGNVIETAGRLYCHGFEPAVAQVLNARVESPSPAPTIQGGDPPNPHGTSAPVSGAPQLGLESLPHAELDKIEAAASAGTMRQRLIEFFASRGGTSTMQEIMAAGLEPAEVYRAAREGKIESIDIRGTYALVLDEGEEAQAAAE